MATWCFSNAWDLCRRGGGVERSVPERFSVFGTTRQAWVWTCLAGGLSAVVCGCKLDRRAFCAEQCGDDNVTEVCRQRCGEQESASALDAEGSLEGAGCEFCPEDRPQCDLTRYTCVECTESKHCSEDAPICNADRACVPCAADQECPSSAPRCDTDGRCVGCEEDRDCRPEAPTCQRGRCIQCFQDQDCSGAQPYCSQGSCVECQQDIECLSGRCEDGICRGCRDDADCAAGLCDDAGRCVACLQDGDCGGGQLCAPDGACVGCLDDAGCQEMERCEPVSRVCVSCDPAGDPRALTCLWRDEFAVFVAPTGADDATGGRESPLRSVQAAVQLATETGRAWVFVCEGKYEEAVEVRAPVSIHGGFACPETETPFVFTDTSLVRIAAPAGQPPLRILGVAERVVVSHVILEATAGTGAGASSIAAVIGASEDVNMFKTHLIAGDGVAGAATAVEPFAFPDPDSLRGSDGTETTGGQRPIVTCPAGDFSGGGRGGDGGSLPESGADGAPSLGAGMGSTPEQCAASNMGGQNGERGVDGGPGLGAAALGHIDGETWVPGVGQPGDAGGVGQGGGGGAGGPMGGGGAGGAGGCGGAGGGGGQGGGASLGVLVYDSALAMEEVTLETANGGDGGVGVGGQVGQEPGGMGGNRFGNGCAGGQGGPGGTGGNGGGGAGGLSVGIVMRASAVDQVGVQFSIGDPGLGGSGIHSGLDGQSATELELP